MENTDTFYPHAFADVLSYLKDDTKHGENIQLDDMTLSTLIDLLRKLPNKIEVTGEVWNPCK